MFERFTHQSRRAVVLAQEEASRLAHNYIGTEHLLAGLRHENQGAGARALESAGISLDAIRREIERLVGRGAERSGSGHIQFTSPAKECLQLSLREAVSRGHKSIGTGHLLLSLISKDDCGAGQILGELGADLEQLRTRAIEEIEAHPEDLEPAPPPRPPGPPGPPRAQPPGTVQDLLDTIDDRLSAVEGHLGIAPSAEPPEAEVARLQAEVARLRALLSEHDIDPGEPGEPGDPPAAAG